MFQEALDGVLPDDEDEVLRLERVLDELFELRRNKAEEELFWAEREVGVEGKGWVTVRVRYELATAALFFFFRRCVFRRPLFFRAHQLRPTSMLNIFFTQHSIVYRHVLHVMTKVSTRPRHPVRV